jgi:CRP-like cAMP-binding protein
MVARQLKKFSLFKGLSDRELNGIAALVKKQQLQSRMAILEEGRSGGDKLYLLNRGKVKVSRMNAEGKEVVLTMLGAGDFFGEMSLIDGSSRSADVTAVETSELFAIRGKDFLKLLKQNSTVSMNLMQVLCRRIRRSDSQIKSLTLMNSMGRIAATLLRLAVPEGADHVTKKAQVIDRMPTRDIIANMSGTPVAVVKRALSLFEETGTVTKDGRRCIIKNPVAFHDMYCV